MFAGIGACIASCTGAAADYCADQFGTANPVCNPATGFCVPCLQDGDCTANASQPLLRPSCIPFADGGAVVFDQPFVLTGGGQCGCSDTAACDDGLTCADPSGPGECISPCTFSDGIDSCLGQNFCNTFAGLCQQCLDDHDCIDVDDSITGGFPAPICNAAGNCVECLDASHCPADRPGCGLGVCGFCSSVADCPPDAGFVCAEPVNDDFGHRQCMLPCVAGDDAGLGSVSDAGPACPASLPFCVGLAGDAGSACGECRGIESGDCNKEDTNCCGTFCAGPNDSCFPL